MAPVSSGGYRPPKALRALRHLFAMVLHLCSPSNPLELWKTFADDLSQDFLYVAGDRSTDEKDAKSTALFHVNEILKGARASLAVYEEMPRDFRNLIDRQPNSDELGQHAELDAEAVAAKAAHDLDLCNDDQKAMYAATTAALDNKGEGVAKVFFFDGPGRAGKSFLYNSLIAHIRGRREKDVIVVASVMFYVPECKSRR